MSKARGESLKEEILKDPSVLFRKEEKTAEFDANTLRHLALHAALNNLDAENIKIIKGRGMKAAEMDSYMAKGFAEPQTAGDGFDADDSVDPGASQGRDKAEWCQTSLLGAETHGASEDTTDSPRKPGRKKGKKGQ